jgi:excisionase family DNA binding protein
LTANTVREAGAVVGIGRSFLYELLARNEPPSVVLGRGRLIPVAALERWPARQADVDVDSSVPESVGRRTA